MIYCLVTAGSCNSSTITGNVLSNTGTTFAEVTGTASISYDNGIIAGVVAP